MSLGRIRRSNLGLPLALLSGLLALMLVACSGTNANSTSKSTVTAATTAPAAPTTEATAPAIATAFPTITLPGLQLATAAASAGPAGATPVTVLQLPPLALQVTDLPSGFALTNSGPGGAQLGSDVLASYQEEFQQRDVTSTQSLQQTIVIVDLLGEYRNIASATAGVKALNVQTLNTLLGGASLTAQQVAIPAIGDDSAGYHFSGTSNGTSIGGYLIVFHQSQIASLIVTAAVKGAESLPQTIQLAQRQDQKLKGG